MSLRQRLSLVVGMALLAGVLLFGGAAFALFVRAQDKQLGDLVQRDLTRIQSLLREPVVGAPLLQSRDDQYDEQFVTMGGVVVIPANAAAAIPLHVTPTLDRSGAFPRMISSVPWRTAGGVTIGTVRLALDVTDAMAARRTLFGALLISGVSIAVLVATAAIVALRSALDPLARLATEARAVDPARPRMTRYTGPADEVADVAAALNSALNNIRDRQDAERASLAEVAHELSAPLSVVAGHLQVLARNDADDPGLYAAHRAAQELLHTSQDLLTLARGELDHRLALEVVELGEVAGLVAREYPGVSGTVQGDTQVVGDPTRLKQLIRNLVRNAVQASGAHDGVAYGVHQAGDTVKFVVRDAGPGISATDLPRVFDRFYSRKGGVGLGLAVAQRIVQQHSGTIEAVSEAGRGATFTVTLPHAATLMDDDSD